MRIDLGTTKGRPRLNRWLAQDREDLLVMSQTPGIAYEWLQQVFRLKTEWFKRQIAGVDPTPFKVRGRENAETVVDGDGWRMIDCMPPDYNGPVPLYVQLALKQDPRSAAELGRVLGFAAHKIDVWRRNQVFEPLTGNRLVRRRGRGGAIDRWLLG